MIPRAKAPCIPFTKQNKIKKSLGIRRIAVLLLGSLKLILGPDVSTVSYLHEMDVPLFWKELATVTDFGSSWSGCGWR
eukprot:1156315-Pelagomonas_calceolata.AAC.7